MENNRTDTRLSLDGALVSVRKGSYHALVSKMVSNVFSRHFIGSDRTMLLG